METLTRLFGSIAKVKILKLFLANPDKVFDNENIFERAKVSSVAGRKEINTLARANLIKKKTFFKDDPQSATGEKTQNKKIKLKGWTVDIRSPFVSPLQNLLLNINPFTAGDIIKRFNSAGKLKLVIIAGIFIQEEDSRVELLIVGDNLKKSIIERSISVLESEVGRELSYAIFETEDFKYRLSVYDKLIRDILDYPHQTIVDKLGIENKSF